MSTDAEKYRIAKEQQDVFRDAIKFCMEGNVKGLERLMADFLKKNADYTPEEFFTGFQSEGRTLLHMAASGGHANVFNSIVEKCKNPKSIVNKKDNKGFTPIINATIGESTEIITTLIQLGADVNSRNNDGAAAIHFAAGDGSVPRLELLCNAGAKVDELSQSGSPLHWASGKARSGAIKFLIQKIQQTQSSKMQELIDQSNKEGLPAVLLAAVASCDLGVSYLVEAGADVGAVVSGNLTVLHICAEHGLSTAVQSIVRTESGQRCCAVQTSEGNTPLQLAAMAGHRDVIRALVPHSDLSYLSSDAAGAGLPSTVFTDKAVPVSDALVDAIVAEGTQRMARWEAAQKEKSAQAAAAAENTEFTKIESQAASSTAVTAEQEAAAERFKETGNAHYKDGKYQLAIDAYTEALYLNKYNATYWSNRSACYLALKEPLKALKDAEICRQLNPTWPRGCYRLASARLELGQYEDAAVAAFEGVKLDEGNKELKALLQRAVKLGQDEHKAKLAAGKS
jgi:ankyrin repeat protein